MVSKIFLILTVNTDHVQAVLSLRGSVAVTKGITKGLCARMRKHEVTTTKLQKGMGKKLRIPSVFAIN